MNIIRFSLIIILSWSVLACSDNRTPEDMLLDEFESTINRVQTLMQRDHVCRSELDAEMQVSEERMAALTKEYGFDMFEPEFSSEQRVRLVELRRHLHSFEDTYAADLHIDSSC